LHAGTSTSERRLVAQSSWRDPTGHLDVLLTSPWYRAIFEMTAIFHNATVEFWCRRNIPPAYLPITTGSISSPMGAGSDSSPVAVELCGISTYLADSMQFLLELGCRLTDEGCYYVMPSFRGEAADQSHLCQFYHSEAEIVGGLEDVTSLVEDYIRYLAAAMIDHGSDTVARFAGDDRHLREAADGDLFASITFKEAGHLLNWDPQLVAEIAPGVRALTRQGERRLMELQGEFIWVTHSEHLSVPFYQAFEDGDRTTARNGDLLFGLGEIVGCGERHVTADDVRTALALHGVSTDCYAWYLRMRELAPLRTAGFGLGVERFLLWALHHDDIRDIPLLLRFNGQQIAP
jgi:asparaginyl-tRNA synthetase